MSRKHHIQDLLKGLDGTTPPGSSQHSQQERFKAGIAAFRAGQLNEAIRIWGALLSASDAAGDEKLQGLVHGNLAMAHQKQGHPHPPHPQALGEQLLLQ